MNSDSSNEEIWKKIPSYPDYYVSNLGRVRSCRCSKEKILSPANSKGYKVVTLLNNEGQKVVPVHRVLLEAFVGPPPSEEKDKVNHLNGDRGDNRLENLEWAAHKDCFDRKPKPLKWGETPPEEREPHSSSKLTKKDVLYIRDSEETRKSLAEEFGVSIQTIFRIKAGKTWKWLL